MQGGFSSSITAARIARPTTQHVGAMGVRGMSSAQPERVNYFNNLTMREQLEQLAQVTYCPCL